MSSIGKPSILPYSQIPAGAKGLSSPSNFSWNSYWTQPYFDDGDVFDKGKVVFTFDDAWGSMYDQAMPLFNSKGVKFTTSANGSHIGAANLCTWSQLREIAASGHDVQCHGYTGIRTDTATDEQLTAEYVDNNTSFVANGLASPNHTVFSGGGYNDHSLGITDNYRKCARSTRWGYTERKDNKFELACYGLTNSIENIKIQMDTALADKKALILVGHSVETLYPDDDPDGSLTETAAKVEELIDYGISIGLDFLTLSELYEAMFYLDLRLSRDCADDQIDITCIGRLRAGVSISIERSTDGVNFSEITTLDYPENSYSDTGLTINTSYYYRARAFRGTTYLPYSRIAIISTPISLVLTKTGTGAAVKRIRIRPFRDMDVTLDGNGKFYTDATGVTELGTPQATTLTARTYNYLYIKVSSGASNLVLPSNAIEELQQDQHLTNSPLLSCDIGILAGVQEISLGGDIGITGDVSKLLNTTILIASGANTLSGSIANLTKLTYLQLLGTNTISGSVTNLLRLTYLNVTGNNTLSGSITNLTRLTYLWVTGTNTLSGSVTNLTKLTYLYVTGSNTISGSVVNLISLIQIYVTGSNTLSGSIAALTSLKYCTCEGSNTLSGSITLLTVLEALRVLGSNTISGSVSNLTSLISLTAYGSNTISGDLGVNNVVNGITTLILNPCAMVEYTGGATWSNTNVNISPAATYGYNVASLSNIVIDMNNSAGGPTSKTITLNAAANASMADTTQGGIWGDFSGVPAPSSLATAYKNMMKVKLNTVYLRGISPPGGSGNGTGFPAGFGDWYRS